MENDPLFLLEVATVMLANTIECREGEGFTGLDHRLQQSYMLHASELVDTAGRQLERRAKAL